LKKAILTKEQAKALDQLLNGHNDLHKVWQKDDIVLRHTKEGFGTDSKKCLNSLPLDTLIRAVYHPDGYEVELTEQEKIQQLWNAEFYLTGSEPIQIKREKQRIFRQGIEQTLYSLGREDLIPTLKEEN
jgi:hypothetical protein